MFVGFKDLSPTHLLLSNNKCMLHFTVKQKKLWNVCFFKEWTMTVLSQSVQYGSHYGEYNK